MKRTITFLQFVLFSALTLLPVFSGNSQVIKAFAQRASSYTPSKLIYNIQGDYTMIGNSNMTLQSYSDGENNSQNYMIYNDIDGDPTTLNSSSADLQFSTENGAIPQCSNIIYAGLYWTGRASDGATSPESFSVTKGSLTKILNKRKISLKGPGQINYTDFTANPGNIYYPNGSNGHMYSGYIEVTDYVKNCGTGTYTAADIALIEGDGGPTGYYGGWGMIIVYENSKMDWRDVTIFDGHAYVAGNTSVNYELPVSGFQTVQSGQVKMKLGLMAGEGDVGIAGDYFQIRDWQNANWIPLSHSGNTSGNFFNSSVNTGGNARNPNLPNNTGVDIAMFTIPNTGNTVIKNNQTSTRFRYGSTQDTYVIFCVAMSVDAYIPNVVALVSAESINGVPVGGGSITVLPGEDIEYMVEIKNQGTEAINNTKFTIPIPYTTNYVPSSINNTYTFLPAPLPNNAYFDPNAGPTGSVIWDFGTLPLVAGFPDSVLARLSFHLKVTDDCNILSNPDCPPKIAIGGIVSGKGATSGSNFALQFIQGFKMSGVCVGDPIKDPLILEIDEAAYVAANCAATPTSRDYVFCDFSEPFLPFDSIAQHFFPGLSFYNTNNVTPSSIKYDVDNPFPITPGTHTYYAIPNGIDYCYYTFTITAQAPITATAILTSPVLCLGGNDGAINLTVSGGSNPYSFAWTGPGAFSAITEDLSNLYAGNYNVLVTDNIGCTATASAIVSTVPDVTPPSILCVPNQTVSTSSGCVYTQTTNAWNASASDNCGVASLTYNLTGATTGSGTDLNGVTFNLGTTTVTWTATDGAANPATCSFTVLVKDNQLPSILTCGAGDQIVNSGAGVCNYTHSGLAWNATASDNCSVPTLTYVLTGATTGTGNSLNGVTFNKGVTTVTWTASDAAGNIVTCQFLITVIDNTAPTIISCGGSTQNINVDPSECNYTVSGTAWNATASDNCGIISLTYALTGATTGTGTTLNGVDFNKGATTVTWTATDAAGLTATCSFVITVIDNILPTIISCGATGNQTVNSNIGLCSYTHPSTTWNATASDNCGVASLTYNLTGATTGTGTSLSGKTFNLGTTTVTWTATDGAANPATCSFNVTVVDNINPTIISCGGSSQEINVDPTQCNYTQTTNAWNATASDNCGVATLTYVLTGATTGTGTTLNGVDFNKGLTTVTWTATDAGGLTATCSFVITVIDNISPTIISCGGSTQNINVDPSECNYTVSGTAWDATASDNCGTVTLTAALTGATTGTGLTTLNGVDFNKGATTVTWTATDAAGLKATCSFVITVIDNINPTIISCGATGNQAVNTNIGLCSYIHPNSSWNATASDNCGVVSITYNLTGATTGTGTSLAGQTFNLGTTTVTWTATDGAANPATCSFNVTVTDNISPSIISCGGSSQEINVDPTQCNYTQTTNAWNATASDNCGVPTLAYVLTGATTGTGTTLNGVDFNKGLTTVTWTATDAGGLTATCSFVITVIDNITPTIISCGGSSQNINVDPAECNYTVSGTAWDATASDNCGVASLTYALTGATTGTGTTLNGVDFNKGATTVTWTATDAAGLKAICSFVITVVDNINPTIISCGGSSQNVNVDPTECNYTQTTNTWNAIASDNCGIASLTYVLTGATTGTGTTLNGVDFNKGATTVTWTATDAAGLTATCSFVITVIDNINPTIISCGGSTQNVNVDPTECNYTQTTNVWNAIASDNCGIASLTYVLTGATTGTGTTLNGVDFNKGLTTVTWTATDAGGLTATCSFVITVIDNSIPTIISCGGSTQSINVDPAECDYTVSGTAWDATASDNCGVPTLAYVLTGATTGTGTTLNGVDFNKGLTTVTWTATDAGGLTATCSFVITVIDNISPTIISCGGSTQNVNVDPSECNYTVSGTAWNATASDNCGVASLTYALTGATTGTGTTLNGVDFNKGATTVTWTATDAAGLTATCSFVITVVDNINPTIISCGAPGDQIVNSNIGLCSYTHPSTTWNASASDNCGVASLTYTLTGATTGTGITLAGQIFNLGTTTVTWTATDGAANPATCSFNVTVNDTQFPSLTACLTSNPEKVANAGDCFYTHSGSAWDAQATDNCSIASIVANLSGATTASGLTTLNGVNFNLGTTTVTWTVTDGSGNAVNCIFDVLVKDNQNPAFTFCVGSTQTVNAATGVCNYTVSGSAWDALATDNCTVSSILATLTGATSATNLTTLNNVTFNLGSTLVTWTVTDQSGNTDVCSYSVVVIDNQLPVISNCPSDISVNNDAGDCSAIVNWNVPTYTDNCGAIMTYTHTPGTQFNIGTTTVTYTVTDGSGNVSLCSFDVTVTDNELPTLTCSADIVTCDSTVSFNLPIASDNCGVQQNIIQTSGLSSGSVFPVGTTTNTFSVTDVNGNTNTCSFDVTIYPTPVISLDVSQVTCNGENNGAIDATLTVGTAPYTYSWSNNASTEDLSGLAPGIYSLTVIDDNGCTSNASTTITEPSLLTLSAEKSDVNCFNDSDGLIDLMIEGGTTPYTFDWSNGSTSEDLMGITAGTYSVTVTDFNGCEVAYSTTIQQPDSIHITGITYSSSCGSSTGRIEITVTGGTNPYTFDWSNGSTGVSLYNVLPGTYTLTVTDANGCSNSYTGTIQSSNALNAVLSINDLKCFGDENGEISTEILIGNAPYTYLWSDGQTTPTATGLVAGSYSVTISDVYGCQITLNGDVEQPDSLYIVLTNSLFEGGFNIGSFGGTDGSISSTVYGGTSPYAYSWFGPEPFTSNQQDITNLGVGAYLLTVTDSNGCIATTSSRLAQPGILEMPSGFSPNGDNDNEFFVVHGIDAYPDNTITIYNRWGNIVYEQDGYKDGWNGNNMKGDPLPDGTYFVILTVRVSGKDLKPLKGYVDLRR